MQQNREDDVEELATAVLRSSRVLVGVAARSLATAGEEVTLPQFRVLVLLQGHGTMRLARLAELLGVNASTAQRMVERLVNRGHVSRSADPDDRRAVRLELTDEGDALVAAVTRARRREVTRIVRRMPPSARAGVVRAMTAFAEAAGEPDLERPAVDLL